MSSDHSPVIFGDKEKGGGKRERKKENGGGRGRERRNQGGGETGEGDSKLVCRIKKCILGCNINNDNIQYFP